MIPIVEVSYIYIWGWAMKREPFEWYISDDRYSFSHLTYIQLNCLLIIRVLYLLLDVVTVVIVVFVVAQVYISSRQSRWVELSLNWIKFGSAKFTHKHKTDLVFNPLHRINMNNVLKGERCKIERVRNKLNQIKNFFLFTFIKRYVNYL